MNTPNIELLDKALEIIKNHPENWNQEHWHCGTTHCLAGHIQLILDNLPPNTNLDETDKRAYGIARQALNISYDDADTLFDADNTLQDLVDFRNLLAENKRIN